MQYLLGVDVGSSECKALLIDTQGSVLARSRLPFPTHRPRPGWAEQDPDEWYQAACRAIQACMRSAGVDAASIVALSVDGPAHNVALMDGSGAVLRPTIHWSDLRSAPQARLLESSHGERVFRSTYSRVNPSWTLTQLRWLQENEPDTWMQLRRILVTKDYVRFRLTGAYETDVYDAIGTQLFDVSGNEWSDELCELAGFRREWLPTVRSPVAIGGHVCRAASADTGLPEGLPVAIGSGDSVVEALGVGATNPGDCVVKLGTSANVNLVTASARPSRKSITYRHLVEPSWFCITATNSGTATMRWFRDTFCRHEVERAEREQRDSFEVIDGMASDAPEGAYGLIFHPYLSGERSPHWDPYLRGDFVGISVQHELKHFARAAMEGVAFSIRDCFDVVESLGQIVERTFILGGGAKSSLWCQIVCDVLGKPLRKPRVEDAAFGAALLAGVATGVFGDWEDAVVACVRTDDIVEPRAKYRHLYDELFDVYRRVTDGIRDPVHDLARLARETESSDENSPAQRS